ncbi:MAG: hypothetical protein Q8Q52_01810 [Acidimicrobiia bacterium]|nr:hypothetical protein [Acidimicrobiia bacterium]
MDLALGPSTVGFSVGDVADLCRFDEDLGYRRLAITSYRLAVGDTLRALAP